MSVISPRYVADLCRHQKAGVRTVRGEMSRRDAVSKMGRHGGRNHCVPTSKVQTILTRRHPKLSLRYQRCFEKHE